MSRRLAVLPVLVFFALAGSASAAYLWNARTVGRPVHRRAVPLQPLVRLGWSPVRELEIAARKAARQAAARKAALARQERAAESWPTFGRTPDRTRDAAGLTFRPPFRVRWTMHGRALIEFPPVLAYRNAYVGTHGGMFFAVDEQTGRIVWKHRLGRCMAASPAVSDGVVYQGLMAGAPCNHYLQEGTGGLIALDARTGRTLWEYPTGIVESSAVVVDHTVFFCSYWYSSSGQVIALDTRTHRMRWSITLPGKLTSSVAYEAGRVYVASYSGELYALSATDGHELWRAYAGGSIYSSPSVGYGRVFIASKGGAVYSFAATSGRLMWAAPVGGEVYGSTALAGGTVYVGSFGGGFYALDAWTGALRWSFYPGSPVLGSPTVMDGLVYFSSRGKTTFALDAASGYEVWSFPDGAYSPIVADQTGPILVGQGRLYGLVEIRKPRPAAQRPGGLRH